MANTLIKFKRGSGLNSDYITTSNFTTNIGTLHVTNGSFDKVEPWVNTTAKQLWVDAVCINPRIKIGSTVYGPTDVQWDSTNNYAYLELPAGPTLYNLKFNSSNSAATATGTNYIYDPYAAAKTVTFGKYLIFDASTGLVSVDRASIIDGLTDIYLDNVEWVTSDNVTTANTAGPYNPTKIGQLAFTWNTTGPTGALITYVDFANYIDTYTSGTYITVTNNTINHNTTTRTDTTSTASPAHGGNFTVVDSVTTNTTGHITAVNVKTVTLPSDNDHTTSVSTTDTGDSGLAVTNSTSGNNTNYDVHHKAVTQNNTTATASTSFGGDFTAISGITRDSYGHVTGVETKTFTLPTPEAATNTTYDLKGDATQYIAGWYLEGNDNSSDYVKLQHAAQSSGVGSMIEFNTQSKASNVTLTAKITIIDGGTFTNS